MLEDRRRLIPPFLHFSKPAAGVVVFSGLCVLQQLELTWFESEGKPVKNYRASLTILDAESVEIDWLHQRALAGPESASECKGPPAWMDYVSGRTRVLDIFRSRLRTKGEQLPANASPEAAVLRQLRDLSPTQFEAVVVAVLRELPHVKHSIHRTRPTADGGFDFYGEFRLPPPLDYRIELLGEAKRFASGSGVTGRHLARLVARLDRGQHGLFVTTSHFTRAAQREILEDRYPLHLMPGQDLVNVMTELKLLSGARVRPD